MFPIVAVFSDEYTVGGSKKKKSEDKPSRIPHFTIAKRCMEERLEFFGRIFINCMYLCNMFVYNYVCTCMHVHCMYVCNTMYACTLYVYIYICICMCVHCMYVCMCMYVCVYIECMYMYVVHVYVCVYVLCMYVCNYVSTCMSFGI